MRRLAAVLAAGAFVASAAFATVSAQATRSVNEGIYTAEQAKQGEPLYREQCAQCHGDNLEGSGPMPPLAGPDFVNTWNGRTVGELFEKTHTTMPATAPGTLKLEDTANLLAFMFSVAKYPAGTAALEPKVDVLQQFKIEAPAAAATGTSAAGAPGTGTSSTTGTTGTAPAGEPAPGVGVPAPPSSPAPTAPSKP
jgi:mono/diheme cytochrome c family protein